mmetsp:Transcript_6065/g.18330  ORF Transcript_6065/g.18330 Transcript_6065/m.18330 type:complete len:427 (+) Transcript_6065:254-1534(+)
MTDKRMFWSDDETGNDGGEQFERDMDLFMNRVSEDRVPRATEDRSQRFTYNSAGFLDANADTYKLREDTQCEIEKFLDDTEDLVGSATQGLEAQQPLSMSALDFEPGLGNHFSWEPAADSSTFQSQFDQQSSLVFGEDTQSVGFAFTHSASYNAILPPTQEAGPSSTHSASNSANSATYSGTQSASHSFGHSSQSASNSAQEPLQRSATIGFDTREPWADKRSRQLGRERDTTVEESDRFRKGRRRQMPQTKRGGSMDGSVITTGFPGHSKSVDSLADHLRGIAVQEPAQKNCRCHVCGKAFLKKYTLIQHLRIHTNERTHKCPVEGCGKDFVQKANLSQHLRYHTGEKPYVCDEPHCLAAYYQLANLKSHLKAKHGRDVPRKCRIRGCGRGFLTVEELNEHLRVDHGRTPQPPPSKTSLSSVSAS